MLFVMFKCGCIGTKPVTRAPNEWGSYIIKDCRDESGAVGADYRNMTGEPWKLMDTTDSDKIWKCMASQLVLGERALETINSLRYLTEHVANVDLQSYVATDRYFSKGED